MTAERAYSMGIEDFEVSVVTPEPSPLAVFGQTASEAVSRLLEDASITVYASAVAEVLEVGRLLIQPQGAELHPQRMVAMPRLEGPAIPGLGGGGPHGFIPIDNSCCVPGTRARIYAAGDAAAYPVKHGGLGAQMADTAASAIARLAGADVEYTEFLPTIRGKVLTGKAPLYTSARAWLGPGASCPRSSRSRRGRRPTRSWPRSSAPTWLNWTLDPRELSNRRVPAARPCSTCRLRERSCFPCRAAVSVQGCPAPPSHGKQESGWRLGLGAGAACRSLRSLAFSTWRYPLFAASPSGRRRPLASRWVYGGCPLCLKPRRAGLPGSDTRSVCGRTDLNGLRHEHQR